MMLTFCTLVVCSAEKFNLGTKMASNAVETEFSSYRFNTVSQPFRIEIFRGSARYLTKDRKSVYGGLQNKAVVVTSNGVKAIVLAPCCQRWKKGDKEKPRGEKMALCGVIGEGTKEVSRPMPAVLHLCWYGCSRDVYSFMSQIQRVVFIPHKMIKQGWPWAQASGFVRTDDAYWAPIVEDYNLWRYEDGELPADSMFSNINIIERKVSRPSKCDL